MKLSGNIVFSSPFKQVSFLLCDNLIEKRERSNRFIGFRPPNELFVDSRKTLVRRANTFLLRYIDPSSPN